MIFISGILLIAAACLAGALFWSLAVHALPLWCGGLAAMAVHAGGGGIASAVMSGLATAFTTLVVGHLLIGYARSAILRIGVAMAFALPAAVTGFHAALGVSAAAGVEDTIRNILAVNAALFTAAAAYRGAMRPRSRPHPAAPNRV